jgi:hypothetical protein
MLKYGTKVNVDFSEADGTLHPGIIVRDIGRLLYNKPHITYVVRFFRHGIMYERALMLWQLSPRETLPCDTHLNAFEHRRNNPWRDKPPRFKTHYRPMPRRVRA